jgi:hypothetical protein
VVRKTPPRTTTRIIDITIIREATVGILVLIACAHAVIYNCPIDLDIKLAWNGFSPAYFLAALRHPDRYPGNYPSGAKEFQKSAPLLADRAGRSPPEVMTIS